MSVVVTTHLNFSGNAREALEFYRAALDGELAAMTYGEMGASADPDWADRIVWGQVSTPGGFRLMAFDVWPDQPYDQGQNAFYVFVRGDDADEITRIWAGLSEGAEIQEPLAASAWAPLYGKLRDRFGVVWAMDVAPAEQPTG